MLGRSRSRARRGTALRASLPLVCGLLASALAGAPANAEILRMIIDRRVAVAADPTTRAPAYEELRGRVVGEVDPSAEGNRVIQDIAAAPRNEHGRVGYVATFTLLRPAKGAGNGVLLDEVPNRGNRLLPFGETGTQFLRARGYSILWVGWQGDLPSPPDADHPVSTDQETLSVPRAPGLTGPYLLRLPSATGQPPRGDKLLLEQGNAGSLAYMPATFETRAAELTGGAPEDRTGQVTGRRYRIPATDWTWWNCKTNALPDTAKSPADLCVKRSRGSFAPDESYTLVFKAKDPLVLGLGLAATRDAASFLRYAASDATGSPNPLAGMIHHVIGQGVSQVGNFAKLFIALGFNRDERGRIVWDAANADIAGRLAPVNLRFAIPGGSATLYAPGSEGLLWWGRSTSSRGDAGSLLDRCAESRTCPRVFETFGSSELWNQRISTGLVTPDLKHDIALPSNVRRYFFPGTTHGGGDGTFRLETGAAGQCTLAANPNPEDGQMRALLVALTDWTVKGTPPPASRFPTLAAGLLVRDQHGALRPLPWSPGPQPFGLSNPTLVYDYGQRFDYRYESGIIDRAPPTVAGIVPSVVPQTGSDGNELGGVPSVLAAAPLGTYLGWNTYRDGPYAGRICSFLGGYIPFARTRAERLARGDPRPSIEERYGTRIGYLLAVQRAIDGAIASRFLLEEDRSPVLAAARDAVREGDLRFLKP